MVDLIQWIYTSAPQNNISPEVLTCNYSYCFFRNLFWKRSKIRWI